MNGCNAPVFWDAAHLARAGESPPDALINADINAVEKCGSS